MLLGLSYASINSIILGDFTTFEIYISYNRASLKRFYCAFNCFVRTLTAIGAFVDYTYAAYTLA